MESGEITFVRCGYCVSLLSVISDMVLLVDTKCASSCLNIQFVNIMVINRTDILLHLHTVNPSGISAVSDMDAELENQNAESTFQQTKNRTELLPLC